MNAKRLLFLSLTGFSMLLSSCGGTPETSSSTGETSNPESSYADVSNSSEGSGPTSSSSSTDKPTTPVIYTGKLRIWYHRDDMNYNGWGIYLWNSAVSGKEYEYTGSDDEYGVYFDIDLSTSEQFKDYPSDDIRVIIKKLGSWGGQSLDTICEFKNFIIEGAGDEQMMNIYLAAGEGKFVDQFAVRQDALGDHFDACYVGEDWKTIYLTGAGTKGQREASEVGKIASYSLYGFTREYYAIKQAERNERREEFLLKTATIKAEDRSSRISIALDKEIDPSTQFEVYGYFEQDMTKLKKKAVSIHHIFDTQKFKNEYTYSGHDLGVTHNADGSNTFKLWAPTASRVQVCFYNFGTPWNLRGSTNIDTFLGEDLKLGQNGVWELTSTQSFVWYDYEVTNSNGVVHANDPYAKASGINSERNYILDWDDASRADPEGWENGAAVDRNLPTLKSANNLTVYEAHIRDLTADPTWVSNKGNRRGTYNAFVEEGTTYGSVKTGFDHIKELGVNAIQLLPVFDQDNDERVSVNYKSTDGDGELDTSTYNWGYNPQVYNSVEGVYSTEPDKAPTRIREFKNLILKCSENGIRVIMDVVYNHMSSVASNSFTKIVPFYYFRTNENNEYTDGSGCGNEIASERPMVSNFIADSVAWWAKEYRVKGFRFDLMGCIDINTMKKVRAAVNEIDPTIVLYGEGWTGGGSALHGDLQSSTNNVYGQLNTNQNFPVGCFNDAGRDGTKGNTVYSDVIPAGGWINESSNVDNVYNSLTQILGENRWAKSANGGNSFHMNPNQTVNYLACHDNYTLYDQINYHFYKRDSTFNDPDHEYVMKAATALTALSLMSQGIGFINGGDELFRQKVMNKDDYWFDELVESYGPKSNEYASWIEGDGIRINENQWLVRNSYKYGDAVNAFKWNRKENATVAKYYSSIREMVALRNSEMGNTLGQNIQQIENSGTTCWSYNDLFNAGDNPTPKTTLLAGAYLGQTDHLNYYIFVSKGQKDSIGIGNSNYEVVYSSNGDHTVGDVFSISNNKIEIDQYETLIVKELGK